MFAEDSIRRDEAVMAGDERSGAVMVTVGKLLLWFAFILCSFVYVGLRSGSHMWLLWVLGQGSLGLLLFGMGKYRLSKIV